MVYTIGEKERNRRKGEKESERVKWRGRSNAAGKEIGAGPALVGREQSSTRKWKGVSI